MSRADHNPMTAELVLPMFEQLLAERDHDQLRHALAELRDAEVADVVAELPDDGRAVVFDLLDDERAAEVFALLENDDQQEVVEALGDEQAAAIFNELDPDDRVDFIEDAPDDVAEATLAMLDPAERAETESLLEYPEDSVGREMTPDFLTLEPSMSVTEALEKVRTQGHDAETLHTLYVVDAGGRLLDHVRLRTLVLARPAERVESLREGQTVALSTHDDRERAVEAMERYDLPVLPVVDDAGLLAGIVTFDDIADVAEEEATEDMHKMGGLEALDAPYLSTGLFALIRKRIFWLLVLFAGGLLTIVAMRGFEDKLEQVVVLALFVPLIIASGGNSGAQAASLMIRSLAIGEVDLKAWRTVVGREIVSGLVMGSVLGLLGLGVVLTGHHLGWLPGHAMIGRIAFVVATSLVGVVVTGTLVGSMLPFALKSVGLDPATGSTPLVATVVDVSGLVIYFAIATAVLGL